MNTILIKFTKNLFNLTRRFNPESLKSLEIEIKRLQGKGSGFGNLDNEADIAIDFLKQRGIHFPIVLDIGANMGLYSKAILRASPKAIIYAFEPSSVARRQIEKMFSLDDRVKVFPFALGNSDSTTTLWSDAPGSGLASLSKRNLDHFGISFEHSEIVNVRRLDSWQTTDMEIPNLIKIDVEGHELDVLLGGAKTIAAAEVVQFEFGGCNIDTRTYFHDFWKFFTDLSFLLYRISDSGPIRISQYSEEDEYFVTTNYIAVKELRVVRD